MAKEMAFAFVPLGEQCFCNCSNAILNDNPSIELKEACAGTDSVQQGRKETLKCG